MKIGRSIDISTGTRFGTSIVAPRHLPDPAH